MTRAHTVRAVVTVLAVSAAPAVPAAAQSFRTVTASRLPAGETALAVDLSFGAGRLHVGPTDGRALYRSEIYYDEEKFRPVMRYHRPSQTLRLGIETDRKGVHVGRWKTAQRLDLALSPHVPITLDAEFGAAEAELELGGLSLSSADLKAGAASARVAFGEPNRTTCSALSVKTGAAEFAASGLGNSRCRRIVFHGGAGDMTLDFTGAWDGEPMDVEVKFAFGALHLRLPRHLGVSVELNKLLASFDQAGFTKRGSRFFSEGYDQANAKLHLEIKAVIGDIDVVWVER